MKINLHCNFFDQFPVKPFQGLCLRSVNASIEGCRWRAKRDGHTKYPIICTTDCDIDFFSTFHHSRKASFYYNILGQIKYTKHTNLSYTQSKRDYFVLNTQQQAFGINKVLAPGQPLRRFSHVNGPGACTLKVQKTTPINRYAFVFNTCYKSHSVYFYEVYFIFFWKGHTHFSCSVLYKVHLVKTMCIELELSF